MTTTKLYTPEQLQLLREFKSFYGIDESQVAFEGASPEPIFTYEALNILRLRLTDIQEIEVFPGRNAPDDNFATVECSVCLADGRKARSFDSAAVGEVMHDGSQVENIRQAWNLAQSRAIRRGIRSVGINLLAAHRSFLETGEAAIAEPQDLRRIRQKQLKALVKEWGHSDADYRDFMERLFGARSSLDLDDIQTAQLISTYRAMLNARNAA